MSSSRLRIAIIGAGPAGLTLGVLLHKNGIPFTLFELRQKPTAEELASPAGSLDLHDETGLAALRRAELIDEFYTMIDDCSEKSKVADKHGNILYEDDDNTERSESRPEISRHKLIQLLLSHCPSSAIRWQHKLGSATELQTSGHSEIELDFGENGKHTFDLVIGADGAWSRVRQLLTHSNPRYSGQQNITLNIRQISSKHPHLAELVGSGTFMALGDRHGVVSQRAVQDTARLYVFVATEDEHFAQSHGMQFKSASEAKGILLDGDAAPLKGYGPLVKELVSVACDDETTANPGAPVTIRPMYTLYEAPDAHSWQHKSGVTVIGDAAHLMPPNGEGVNIAMKDALVLSEAIVKAHKMAGQSSSLQTAVDSLLVDFERDMLARAKVVAGETAELLAFMYGDDGAKNMAGFFSSISQPVQSAAGQA